MKVRDLKEEIERLEGIYPDFPDWQVFTEQIQGYDKEQKRQNPQWKWLSDSEGWEYIECAGFWTHWEKEKAFSINVNY